MGRFRRFLMLECTINEASDYVLQNSADEADEAVMYDLKKMGYGDSFRISTQGSSLIDMKKGMFKKVQVVKEFVTLVFDGVDPVRLVKDLKANGYSMEQGNGRFMYIIKKGPFVYDLMIQDPGKDPYPVIHAVSMTMAPEDMAGVGS